MRFERIQIKAGQQSYFALVASGDKSILLGQAELDQVRLTGRFEYIGDDILTRLEEDKDTYDVVIVRPRKSRRKSLWQFDTSLNQDGRHQLAILLVRSQMEADIRLAKVGIMGHFIVALGEAETLAFQKAVSTLLSEIEQHLQVLPPWEAMRQQLLLHKHLLNDFSHFSSMDYKAAVKSFVPHTLPGLAKGKESLKELLEKS